MLSVNELDALLILAAQETTESNRVMLRSCVDERQQCNAQPRTQAENTLTNTTLHWPTQPSNLKCGIGNNKLYWSIRTVPA